MAIASPCVVVCALKSQSIAGGVLGRTGISVREDSLFDLSAGAIISIYVLLLISCNIVRISLSTALSLSSKLLDYDGR